MDAALPPGRDVIDLAFHREARQASARKARVLPVRMCCHCGAALGEGDSDDDCSSVGVGMARSAPPMPRRRVRAE